MRNLTRIGLCIATAALLGACSDEGSESPAGDASDTHVSPDPSPDSSPDSTVDSNPDAPLADVGPGPIPACADVVEEGLQYTPMGCGYAISHPRGIVDVLSSCGEPGDRAFPVSVHLTFPAEDAARNVAVSWTTGIDTRVSDVELGDSPDELNRTFRGHSFTYWSLDDRVVHEVHLCGLEPSRTYYYRAGGAGVWSDVYSFTTAPDYGSEERFTFGLTGDTRHDTNEPWGQAAQAMHEAGAEFILFTGDAVETGTVQAQWDSWFAAGTPYLAEMPFVPANGNHDLFTLNYSGQFALPHIEDNFYVRYGNAIIISLNDFPIHDPLALTRSTREFLDQTLTEHADATWKVVINHRAFFSASSHGSQEDVQDAWLDLIDEHEVDLVFNGHDHNYERSVPIRNEAEVPFGDGTIFVVAAGVGAPLYDNGTEWHTHVSEMIPSFGIVEVDGDTLEFTAYRLDGTVLDEFTWSK